MKNFEITDRIRIECHWAKTRVAFKHVAELYIDGSYADETKVCYLNRTWESYEFQSVIQKLIEKTKELSKEEKEVCREYAKQNHSDNSFFNAIGAVAKLGELFCDNQKDKNAWKKRMIVAGLGNKGLSVPENFDNLNENEKEKRLNAVIDIVCEK